MNKRSLINKLQSEVKLSKTQSEQVFNLIFDKIKKQIKNERHFKVDGFGNFRVERRKMQTMVDYNKKAVVLLPPKEKIVFDYQPSENTNPISKECTNLIKEISSELKFDEIKVYNYFFEIFSTLKSNFQKSKNINISEFGKFRSKDGKLNFSPVKKFAEDVNYYFSNLRTVTVRTLAVSELKPKTDTKPLQVSAPKSFIKEEEGKIEIKVKQRFDVKSEPEKVERDVFIPPVIEDDHRTIFIDKPETEIIPEPDEIIFEDIEDVLDEVPPVDEEIVQEEIVQEEIVQEEVVQEEVVQEEVVQEEVVQEEVVQEEVVQEEVVQEETDSSFSGQESNEIAEDVKEEISEKVDKIVDEAVEEIQSVGEVTDINEEIKRRTELFKEAERKFDSIHIEDIIPSTENSQVKTSDIIEITEPVVNNVETLEHFKTAEEISDDFEKKLKQFENKMSKSDFDKSVTEIKDEEKQVIEGIDRPSILSDSGIMINPFETGSNEPPSEISELVIPPFFEDEKIKIPGLDSETKDSSSDKDAITEFKPNITEELQQDTFITPDAKIKFVKEEEETLSIGDIYEKLRESFRNGNSTTTIQKEEVKEGENSRPEDIIEEAEKKPKDTISYEISSNEKDEENIIEPKAKDSETETETEKPPVMNEISETKIMPPPGSSEKFEEEFRHFFNSLSTEPVPQTSSEPPQSTIETPVTNEMPKSLDDYLETTSPPEYEPFDPGVKEVEKVREEERQKVFNNTTPSEKISFYNEEEVKEEKKFLGLPLYAIISAIIILTIIIGGIFMYKSFVEKAALNVNPPTEEQKNP